MHRTLQGIKGGFDIEHIRECDGPQYPQFRGIRYQLALNRNGLGKFDNRPICFSLDLSLLEGSIAIPFGH